MKMPEEKNKLLEKYSNAMIKTIGINNKDANTITNILPIIGDLNQEGLKLIKVQLNIYLQLIEDRLKDA